jgi:succinate dehydrogenase / fumarate reductase flavoprotein subunit
VPYTIGGHFAGRKLPRVSTDAAEFAESERMVRERTERLMASKGTRTADSFHRELGKIMWDHCGMARSARGLAQAKEEVRSLRSRFWEDLCLVGSAGTLNQQLEHAGRVADFLEFAELVIDDASYRTESCGGHFREESQTEDGEAKRDDERFTHVAAWQHLGPRQDAALHKEPLVFEYVRPSQRSYK